MLELKPNVILDQSTQKIIVQTPLPPFNCLAIEGGGVRGAAYAGAIKILEKYHLFDDVRYVAGSSAGAIVALVIALGYSFRECEIILGEMPMHRFLEGADSYFKQIVAFLTNKSHSFSSGNAFYIWLQKLVKEKLGNENATFSDLAKACESQCDASRFKYLFVTGTNLSLKVPECEIFSHETTPDMSLALSVRISSSFPFVFEPVKWKEWLYADGGLIKNLPTRIFDDRKYLPIGYDFNHKGMNPGVLALKVDSKDEIAQIFWNIKKKVALQNVKEIVSAYFEALLQNIDTQEMREARMVIPLEDGDVQTLQFSIDSQGRVNLVTSAEKITLDFLENHIHEIYDIDVYENSEAWLSTLSLNEIDTMIAAYRTMRISSDSEDMIRQINHYLVFLEHYFQHRRGMTSKPTILPPPVNLVPNIDYAWHHLVKKDMEIKLKNIIWQIEHTKIKARYVYDDLMSRHGGGCNTIRLHYDGTLFQHIQQLIGFQEYLKILEEEKHELINKLGAKKAEASFVLKSDQQIYAKFCEEMNLILNHSDATSPLQAILQPLNLYDPILRYQSSNESDNIIFSLDLRRSYDCKIYFIAALFYLRSRKSKDLKILLNIYHAVFLTEALVFPENITLLESQLNQKGLDLYLSIYRIEELVHFFERTESPKVKPSLDIDHMLGLSNYSIFKINPKIKQDETEELELKTSFKSLHYL